MEQHLQHWLEKAEQSAQYVIDNTEQSNGACEDCGKVGHLYWFGTVFECGECFTNSVEYWEKRGGHSSEIIFDGDPFPVDEFEWESPAHRQIVARYIFTLTRLVK